TKTKNENHQNPRAAIEQRPAAKTRHSIIASPRNRGAHGIDAVSERTSRIELQIGGRKSELTPTLVAVNDRSGNKPRIAQEFRGIVEPSGGERSPDWPRRDRTAPPPTRAQPLRPQT